MGAGGCLDLTENKKPVILTKIVAIPIEWMLYELPSNAFEIMGGVVQNPPLVVAESLVESGQGRRIRKIETGIEIEDTPEHPEEEAESPWYPDK
jgi:hypothetical protein